MAHHEGGLHGADHVDHAVLRLAAEIERIVADIEELDVVHVQRGGGGLRLGPCGSPSPRPAIMPSFHSLGAFAALAEGQAGDRHLVALLGMERDGAAAAPDEVLMQSKTQTERALITLRQRILSGAYPGGERLYEVALANDLQISRTPVRAALSKLAEEGLLDRIKAGGFAVRRFDLRDVMDTIELRGVLEGTAARLAAERGAQAGALDAMRTAVSRIDAVLQADDVDMSLYSKWNSAYHAALGDSCGSPVLVRELKRVTALPFASPSAFADAAQLEDRHVCIPGRGAGIHQLARRAGAHGAIPPCSSTSRTTWTR
jgi:GntR family transcriptional regulator of vanillate catabolism